MEHQPFEDSEVVDGKVVQDCLELRQPIVCIHDDWHKTKNTVKPGTHATLAGLDKKYIVNTV